MKTAITLKLDFKIDQEGILRIFDIGDGLDADITGFEDTAIAAILLRDLHEANDSALATVFGELPLDAMQPETLHIPILQRALSNETWNDPSDLVTASCQSVLPYSYVRRAQAFAAYYWGKSGKLDNIMAPSMALIGMEMHKLFWYILLEKHMKPAYRKNILYWSNDQKVTALDLNKIDMSKGIFIKIADRSIGGGTDVHYAANAVEATQILTQLHNRSGLDQHVYVLEPAYQSIKSYQNKNYDATGRAFVTLIFDPETRALEVKIAGAKWMLPLKPLQEGTRTQAQVLANVAHMTHILPFAEAELTLLREQIVSVYGEIFKTSIEHDNLIQYCHEHPIMEKFLEVFKPNAVYRWAMENPHSNQNFKNSLFSLIHRIFPINFEELTFKENKGKSIYSSALNTKEVMKKICALSFLERSYNFIAPHIQQGDICYNITWITQNLNAFIKQFLKAKNATYDTVDLGRASRQAANIGDIEVLKLLIGTNRASINAVSPTTKMTALDFAIQSKCDTNIKEKCIQFLMGSGAKSINDLNVSVALKR